MRFKSGEIELAGTLTLPDGEPPFPAVVLISGSGPQTRDEDTPGVGGLKLHFFRKIAHRLGTYGIACLRYDDRGVGESGGTFATASLSDFVSDAKAAIEFLRNDRRMDSSRIAIVGHSEGAIIAPMIASHDRAVAAIVLLASPARSLDKIILEQQSYAGKATGMTEEERKSLMDDTRKFIEFVLSDEPWDPEKVPAQYRTLGESRQWFKEHFLHDPLSTIAKVTCPVLILQGGKDIQVNPQDSSLLGNAHQKAGNPDFEVKILPDLNHLFVKSKGEGLAEYSDQTLQVDSDMLDYLAQWLKTRLINRR